MNNIFIRYKLKWRFKDYPNIQVSECKKVFNIKTGNEKLLTVNGGYSRGYWISPKKFIIYSKLNKYLEAIPKNEYIKDDFLTNL